MTGRRRTVAIGATIVAVVAVVAGAVAAGHPLQRRDARSSRRGAPPTRASSARSTPSLREDDARGEAAADPAALRRAGHRRGRARRASAGSSASPTRPRSTTSSRSRWRSRGSRIPILFAYDTIHGYRTIFPIPLGAASSFDPSVATADATIGARETGDRRHQADLQPDGRRLARAALGPHRRGRRRGPVPRLGLRRRAGQGRPGRRLLRARQGRRRASSTSPPTASPRAAATTTPPTCPSSGCATSTCRRSRRRSTPAPTP